MLDLVLHPDELLRDTSEPVSDIDKEIASLAHEMIDTMHEEQGIGLAGVQIGRLVRVFVTDVTGDQPRVFINPRITATSPEEVSYEEGCLSIPGAYADLKRSAACTVEAFDENGRPFTLEAEGLLARVVMHELDHLDGVLFFDHLRAGRRRRLLDRYLKAQEKKQNA